MESSTQRHAYTRRSVDALQRFCRLEENEGRGDRTRVEDRYESYEVTQRMR